MTLRQDAETIYTEAIAACLPDAAVREALAGRTFGGGRLLLVAAGKAAWQMANCAAETLGGRLDKGVVITKYGHAKGEIPRVRVFEAGHPQPDERSLVATQEAIDLVSGLGGSDMVLFLLSGGGSALFEKPLIPLEELRSVTAQLLGCGAEIKEINTIRKRLSAVKGGRFAQLCAPARVITIVLSDVVGDSLDMIASGPACPDSSTAEEALAIARRLKITMSDAAWELLAKETPKKLDNVETIVRPGETLGVVGESGCGKSVTSLSIMRLFQCPPGRFAGGEIWFKGRNLMTLPIREMRRIRGCEICMIFQEPMTSLNPVYTVGNQIAEAIRLHQKLSRREAMEKAREVLDLVGIAEAHRRLRDYPHQMSGGMRQRVMIAMALSCRPSLLIADEPTTALDVTIQAQILNLMNDLKRKLGTAILFITHDLGVIADTAQNVIVMYAGRVMEQAAVEDLFGTPLHPYTQGLMGSIPSDEAIRLKKTLTEIKGMVPSLTALPSGCLFHPRCSRRWNVATRKPRTSWRSGRDTGSRAGSTNKNKGIGVMEYWKNGRGMVSISRFPRKPIYSAIP